MPSRTPRPQTVRVIPSAPATKDRVILSERGPERFRGPEERELFGAGSGVVSEESAFRPRLSTKRQGTTSVVPPDHSLHNVTLDTSPTPPRHPQPHPHPSVEQ